MIYQYLALINEEQLFVILDKINSFYRIFEDGTLIFRNIVNKSDIDFFLRKTNSKMVESTLSSAKYDLWIDKIYNNGIFIIGSNSDNFCCCAALYVNDYHKFIAYLTYISVVPNMIGKGIGKYLMKEVERICLMSKMKWLKLEVKKENLNAINFYKKLGFDVVSENYTSFYMIKKL